MRREMLGKKAGCMGSKLTFLDTVHYIVQRSYVMTHLKNFPLNVGARKVFLSVTEVAVIALFFFCFHCLKAQNQNYCLISVAILA